jgi:D-alanine transaminase
VVTFPDFRWGRRDIKSVNLLANCFAAQAAREADCTEAILVTPDGRLTEGSHTNLFGVKNGQVMTSPNGHHILPGITRGLVLRLAERASVPVIEEPLLAEKLQDVDELFLTGTTTEVLAVSSVDGNSIGTGTCGPVTEKLCQAYKDSVAEWLEASM